MVEDNLNDITKDLRCIVCQNQSLFDANNKVADNLKLEISKMLGSGMQKPDIITEMTLRYGDFISYKPSNSLENMGLWVIPLILLLLAGTLIYKQVRRK